MAGSPNVAAMNKPALIYSEDQAAAHDGVSEMLRGAGIDLEDSLLMPPPAARTG